MMRKDEKGNKRRKKSDEYLGGEKEKMKTKNKTMALVEIAIVLCSLFLVAIPAIAAEQATQKVSASTITTASEDDYVLGVYGNGNEDDTIDMGDVVYTKLAIFGKKPKTELCDAKYDGRINVLDVIQTKLIILGKEKEVTIIDSHDRIVTVKKPLNRIVVACGDSLELLRAIKLESARIVGITYDAPRRDLPLPEYQDKPTVDSQDPESILNLHPDVVILTHISWGETEKTLDILESAGIPVICVYGGKEEMEDVKRFGYLFEKKDEADEFIDWYEGIINQITGKVEEIPEENKPKVYFEGYKKWYISGEDKDRVGSAGGKNIFEEGGIIDAEAVIDRNPEIIVKTPWYIGGYHIDADDTVGLEEVRDEIISRPELQKVPAVKEGRVYVISGYITTWGPSAGCRGFLSVAYMAKWFHPELFKDLDPKALHQEYLTEFLEVDIGLDEKGVFVYPEPS
jgi:iron complex transport system substrate-binding protein